MEARQVRRATGDAVELLRAVDARTVTVLGNVYTNTDDVGCTEHIAVMALRVLPLVEDVGRCLSGGLRSATAEVFKVVVGDVLSIGHGVRTVESALPQVLVRLIVAEVVAVGHVLAPRASIGSDRVRHDNLGQASAGAVGIHLLNDEGLDDLGLGVVVNLGPVNPVETAINGRVSGGTVTDRGIGLLGALLSSLKRGLRVGEVLAQLSLALRVSSGARRGARGGGSVLREQRVVLGVDASVGTNEGAAERIIGGAVSLSQGGDHNEGRCDRGGSEHHRRVSAGELERH